MTDTIENHWDIAPNGSGANVRQGGGSREQEDMLAEVETLEKEEDVGVLLQTFLACELAPAALEISGLRRASYGFSCENWPFDVLWTSREGRCNREELILRRDPAATILESDRSVEFEILKALEGYDAVPTPKVRWLDRTGARLGRPSTIMERCPGVCDPMALSGGTSLLGADDRLALARRLMETLQAIHAFDWKAGGLDKVLAVPAAGTTETAAAALDHWENEFRANIGAAYPEYEYVLAWLRAHLPVSDEIALVHADFKPGNTLIAGSRVVAVLDWETAHLGDPLEDVAWVTNPLRASEHQIPGVWEADAMLGHYRARTGRAVDPGALGWWRVLGNFKLLTISLTGLRAFLDGSGDRPMSNPRHYLPVLLDEIRRYGNAR